MIEVEKMIKTFDYYISENMFCSIQYLFFSVLQAIKD